MATISGNCPHCGTKHVTFLIRGWNPYQKGKHEVFCTCRHCYRSIIFNIDELTSLTLHDMFQKDQYISPAFFDKCEIQPPIILKNTQIPENTPRNIAEIFEEAAICAAIGCPNAAAAMFRLVVDLTTKSLLPLEDAEGPSPNRRQREVLFERLKWLFETGSLSADLHDLADCIREDGNDGAHDGTIGGAEVADLSDFCVQLLTRIFTMPAQIENARLRRIERRRTP